MLRLTLFLSLLVAPAFAHALQFSANNLANSQNITFPQAKAKATVVAFLSAKCPCSAGHEVILKALYEQYAKEGISFIGVHSNQDETLEQTKVHFKEAGLPFPVLQDEGAKIANKLKALKTPHVFIIKDDQIVFQGGVDDSADPTEARKHFLSDALKEIQANKPITVSQARALGCVIKR